jgi:hypothetical protein
MPTITDSRDALMDAARERLETYQSGGDLKSLAERLPGGVRRANAVPDTNPFPYAALRLINGRQATDNQLRYHVDLECFLFGHGRTDAVMRELEASATIVERALNSWRDTAGGLFSCRVTDTDDVPPFDEPADKEVVQIRVIAHLRLYPHWLAQDAAGYVAPE